MATKKASKFTVSQLALLPLAIDFANWGKASVRRIVSAVKKHDVLFEMYRFGQCGCPIAYAAGWTPKEGLGKEFDFEHYRYEVSGINGSHIKNIPRYEFRKKSTVLEACKLVLSGKVTKRTKIPPTT